MSPDATFRAKAPVLMQRLLAEDFGFNIDDVCAIAGNAGHESAGFTKLQEIAPTVKGSRGGFGWFQWTGPRRRTFEAFCKNSGLAPTSDEVNIAFIIRELKTTERAAVEKTKAAPLLADKVVAFEAAYERAGVKHYPSRLRWAQIARDAWYAAKGKGSPPTKTTTTKWAIAGAGGTAGGTIVAGAASSFASSAGYGLSSMLDWRGLLVIGALIGVAAMVVLLAIGVERRERLWDSLFGVRQ